MQHDMARRGIPIPTDPIALLTTPQVQELLGVGRITIYRWVRDGYFPPPDKLLPGRPHRKAWKRSTVETWIATQSDPK